MESKIIKAFFDGTLSDEMIKSPRAKEYKDIDKHETELYDKLRPQLTGEQFKLLDEFVDLYGERTRWKKRIIASAVSSSECGL